MPSPLLSSRTPSPTADLASPTILPLSPSAQTEYQLCECTTRWQHAYFYCPGAPESRLRKWDGALEEGGKIWDSRDEVWKRMLRGAFEVERLREEPATRDLWNALHQEKEVLVLFLEGWHCSVRDKWVDIHGLLDVEPGMLKREQEITFIRGMGLCNKIAGVLLGNKGVWDELYGTGMDEEEREALRKCVFDCSDMKFQEGGGVEGEIKLDYHNPWGGCECEDCEEGNAMKDFGTQTETGFDSLYDYEDKGCQTEVQGDEEKGTQTEIKDDEEKGRHDSGVGLEEEITEGVKIGCLKIEEEGEVTE